MFQKVLREEMNKSVKRALEKGESSSDSEKEEEYFKAPKTMSLKKQKELSVVNALKVVEFRLIDNCNQKDGMPFHPGFAHQVFGDDEKIIGYKDLKIVFYYGAASLKVYIDATFSEKTEDATPKDLMSCFQEWMPDEDVELQQEWRANSLDALFATVKNDMKQWKPPGSKVSEYQDGGDKFEVWHGKFSDVRMRRYHQRMRPFMIWFVDGARYLDDTDEKWDIFMLFKISKEGNYCFSGYVTCYPFFSWSGARELTPLERQASRGIVQQISKNVEEVVSSIITKAYDGVSKETKPWYERRFRISQFLILPPFQRKGHGLKLLNIVYDFAKTRYAPIRDFAVEDPSPNFVKLRDYCDLSFVHEKGLLQKVQGNDLDAIAEALRERHVCEHQINRIKEIVRYMEAFRIGGKAVDDIRVEIKQRIYKENSADIPAEDDDARKEAIATLWNEEEQIFQGSLTKLKLIEV